MPVKSKKTPLADMPMEKRISNARAGGISGLLYAGSAAMGLFLAVARTGQLATVPASVIGVLVATASVAICLNLWLAYCVYRSQPVWAQAVLLGWGIFELFGIFRALYPDPIPRVVVMFGFSISLFALKSSISLRKAEGEIDADEVRKIFS